jgi:hypothetical protein
MNLQQRQDEPVAPHVVHESLKRDQQGLDELVVHQVVDQSVLV